MAEEIKLQIKNPSKNIDGDFKIRVSGTATVGDVKAKLQSDYPGKPEKGAITIIYAGRVLKQDDAPLASFLQQNMDPGVPHTLHIVIKPGASAVSSPAPAAAPGPHRTPAPSRPVAAVAPSSQTASELSRSAQQHSAPPLQQASSSAAGAAGPAVASVASTPPAATQPNSAASGGQEAVPPPVSAPIQGYAYTIPSPYAIYNPALSAAYTAALQALQAATPPAPTATSGPANSQLPATEGPLAAYNAALQTLAGQTIAVAAGAPPVDASGAMADVAGPSQQPATEAAGAGTSSDRFTEGTAAPGFTQSPGAAGPAGAAAAAGGVGGGVLGAPPLALPLAPFAYLPAFIPIPQPVLTAIPNPQFGQGFVGVMAGGGIAGTAEGQQQGAAEAQQGQQQPLGQPGMVQGIPPAVGQFIPIGPMQMGMFPAVAAGGVQEGMQVHVVEAVPGEGVRRRRVDVNQPGALPPEVMDALRAAQQQGQLPGNMAQMVAQLQRQQAARRDARRARGFQIQINLGRINIRAVLQLLFMVVVMAPYFSFRRLVMMMAIAALLNVARLEAVRRALNRMAVQLNLPLQQEGRPAAPAGGVARAQPAQQDGPGDQPPAAGAAAGQDGAPADPAAAVAGGNMPAPPAAQAGGAAAGAGALPAQQLARRPRAGLLQEVQALVVGFITSLLPGWNVDPGDAAAFAAAQEAEVQEQAAAAAGQGQ